MRRRNPWGVFREDGWSPAGVYHRLPYELRFKWQEFGWTSSGMERAWGVYRWYQ